MFEALTWTTMPVVVHTGYWGLWCVRWEPGPHDAPQGLAAAMAGLDRLAFHTGDPGGRASLDAALRLTRDDLSTGETVETRVLIGRIGTMGLEWGVSDGN